MNTKNLLLAFLSITLFSACSANEAPSDAGEHGLPENYVISVEDELAAAVEEGVDSETDELGDLSECREKNAEVSLQLESAEKKLLTCKESLEKETEIQENKTGVAIKASQLKLIRYAVMNTDQPEYPFSCGKMSDYFRKSWFDTFIGELNTSQVRFSNGFLESEDLFAGCHSDQGKMAFFLGAERNDDLQFVLIKFDISEKTLEKSMMFDGSDEAIVTKLGKRSGAYIKFPADDGRIFRYYYDANIVVDAALEEE